jgi:hypothetical protein
MDRAKLGELRRELAASDEEGGEHSLDDVHVFARERLARAE